MKNPIKTLIQDFKDNWHEWKKAFKVYAILAAVALYVLLGLIKCVEIVVK